MACTSGSVKTVADKTVTAADQIKKLETMVKGQSAAKLKEFESKISKSFTAANITDGRLIKEGEEIKTEYTSEFSLDKIAAVVNSALKAAVAATDPKVPNPAMSPAAITAYTDLVNTVAEAAKSSSTSAASMSYSMNRLSPGVFAFLYATSVSITDKDTFGTEAVTTTSIYFRLYQSIDDLKNETAFGVAVIESANLLNMKRLQAGLTDRLASGEISVDIWMKLDASYQTAIDKIQARLDEAEFKSKGIHAVVSIHSVDSRVVQSISGNQAIVVGALARLSKTDESYQHVIKVSEERIASGYFK